MIKLNLGKKIITILTIATLIGTTSTQVFASPIEGNSAVSKALDTIENTYNNTKYYPSNYAGEASLDTTTDYSSSWYSLATGMLNDWQEVKGISDNGDVESASDIGLRYCSHSDGQFQVHYLGADGGHYCRTFYYAPNKPNPMYVPDTIITFSYLDENGTKIIPDRVVNYGNSSEPGVMAYAPEIDGYVVDDLGRDVVEANPLYPDSEKKTFYYHHLNTAVKPSTVTMSFVDENGTKLRYDEYIDYGRVYPNSMPTHVEGQPLPKTPGTMMYNPVSSVFMESRPLPKIPGYSLVYKDDTSSCGIKVFDQSGGDISIIIGDSQLQFDRHYTVVYKKN